MRITLAGTTALTALALGLSALTAPVSAAPPPSPTWTNTQLLGKRELLSDLDVAPDGYAVAWTADQVPLGCYDYPEACHPEDFFDRPVRTAGGTWAESSGTLPDHVVFDAAATGWGLVRGSAAGVAPTLSTRPAGGTWSAGEAVPLTPAPSTYASLTLTSNGAPVVWNAGVVDGTPTLQVTIRTQFGWVDRTRTTDGPARVIAGADGIVRAAWLRDQNQVVVSDLEPDGTWGPAIPAVRAPSAATEVTWLGTHALLVRYGEYPAVTEGVVTEGTDGVWGRSGIYTFTQPANVTASASGGPRGLVTLSYTERGRIHVLQQQDSGNFSESTVGSGTARSIVVDARGNATVLFATSGGSPEGSYTQLPVNGGWTTARKLPDPIAAPDPDGAYVAGVDAQGTVTVGGVGTVDGVKALYTQDLVTPIAVSSVNRAPSGGWAAAASFGVGWRTTWLDADSHDVRYRERRITSARFVQHQLATASTASTAKVRGKAGRVYCLSARAQAGTTTGPWGAENCVATPLDDRSLKGSKGDWTRAGGSTSSTKGATLASPRIHGTRFALLVHPSARAGAIRVTLGGQRLGTVKLTKGNPKKARVITLRGFKRTQHGKLVITVVSSGKPVRIDGIYAR